MKTLSCILFTVLFFFSLPSFAQINDCAGAEVVCSNDDIAFNPQGPGFDDYANPNNNEGCIVALEQNSAWYYFEIDPAAPPGLELGFTISPNGGLGEDYDWALYGPDVNCEDLGDPIRCSSSSAACGFCPETGMGMGAMDTTEGPGTGDGFVSTMIVEPGQGFYLMIDNWLGTNNGFMLSWTGPASNFLNCDAEPPCALSANAGEDLTACEGDPAFSLNGSSSGNNGGETYSWTGTNGGTGFLNNPNIANPTVNLPNGFNGTITYTLVVEEDACSDDDEMILTVNPLPSVTVNQIGPFCETDPPVPLSANPTGGIWGGAATGNQFNPAGNGPGIHTVTYTYTDANGCTTMESMQVQVFTNPTVTINPDPAEFCQNIGSVTLTATGSGVAGGYTYSWSTPAGGGTGPTFEASLSGQYTVSVTDSNGCTNFYSTNVTSNPNPTVQIINPGPICENTDLVTLSAVPSGGTFTGAIITPEGDIYPNTVPPGTYPISYTYVDQNNCDGTDNIDITIVATPEAFPSNNGPLCEGQPILLFGQTNGTGANISWQWSGPNGYTSNLQNPTNATVAGPYILQVTIDGCQSDFEATTVMLTESPDAEASNNGPYCPGQAIELFGSTTASGNEITYEWSGPNGYSSTQQNPQDAFEIGTYSLIVTVDDCPSEIVTTEVEVNQAPDAEASNNGPYCEGESIELFGNTNTSGTVITYTWNGPNGYLSFEQNPLDATEPGTYELIVDVDGCTSEIETTEIQVNPLPQPEISGENTFCEGGSSLLNAGAGYDLYEWNDGNLSQIINVDTEGFYEVTVTDENGCTGIDGIVITINPNPEPSIAGSTTFCEGNSTTLDAGGPYDEYLWSNTSTSQTISVDVGGTFSVVVTDANGCTGTDQVEVTESTSLNPLISGDTTFCTGTSTLLDAGAGFETYLWSDDSEDQTLEVTSPGDYTVTVSDNSGCTGEATVSIVENQLPDVSITGNQPFCEGGTVTLDAGSGFSEYVWSDLSIGQTLNVSLGGDYGVTVTDANGCTNEDLVTVIANQNPVPQINGENSFCAGDTITIDAGNGYEAYLWNDGTTNQTCPVFNAGVYSVTVTDSNGCTGEDAFTVSENQLPAPEITGDFDYCEGSSANIEASSGFVTYEWSNGLQTASIDVSIPGDYSVVVTDGNGCTGSESVTISENPNPQPDITGLPNFCTDNSTTIDAGGGYSAYLWSNGETTQSIEVSVQGDYSVTVTDANNCTGENQFFVEESASLNPAISGDLSLCEGASSILDAGAGYDTYLWSTGEVTQTIEVNTEQNYSVIVTDANGCSGEESVFLEVFENPTVSIMGDNTFCSGDSEVCTASPGFVSYLWSDGSTDQSITVTSGGTFTVTVTDINGCTATSTMEIEEIPNPTPTISGDFSFCSGESATLETEPFYDSYSWSSGGSTPGITVSDGGNYTVIVSNEFGCTGTASATVTENEAIPPVITGDLAFCEGSSTLLNAGSYSEYQWSNGETTQTIEVFDQNNYEVIVTDQNGCTASGTVSTQVNSNPEITIGGSTSYCIGGFTILDAGGGYYTYEWNDGSDTQTITVSSPGDYSVEVTDVNGCSGTDLVTIEESTSLNPVITGSDSFCENGNTLLDAGTGFDTYLWSDGSITQTLAVDETGNYAVTVSDTQGCTGETSINVNEVLPPSAEVLTETELCNTEAGGSVLNLYDLILSGDASGTWEDTDNSGAVGLFNNLNFNEIPAGIYNFTYTTNSAIPPCPETEYQVAVTIIDCSCPEVLFFNADPLCNGGDVLDLSTIENTTESGSWSIVQTPGGSNPAVLSGTNFDATAADPGNYILEFELANQPPPGCATSFQVNISIDEEVNSGVSGQPIAFCENEDESIDLADWLTGADQGGIWSETSSIPSQGQAFDAANGTFETQDQDEGTYTFQYTVSSTGVCPDQSSEVSVIINESPDAMVTDFMVLDCTNPVLSLSAEGSSVGAEFGYDWTGPGIILDGNENTLNPTVDQPGLYILTVTNTNTGCTYQSSTEVTTDQDTPQALAGNDDSITCNNPNVNLQASGDTGNGFLIEWSGPGINAGNMNAPNPLIDQPGMYILSITNENNGCISTPDTVFILDGTDSPDISIQLPTNALDCNNPSISLTGASTDNNVSFEWFDPGNSSISNSEIAANIIMEGVYTLIVTNTQTGCTASETANITDNTDYPDAAINSPALLDCINTEITLDGTNSSTGSNIEYLWNGPAGGISGPVDEINANVILPGVYDLIVTNTANGCTNTAQILVDQDAELPTVQINLPEELDCTVDEVTLDGTGSTFGNGIFFSWVDENGQEVSNEISFETSTPGDYELIVFNSNNGCSNSELVTVLENTNVPSAALLNIQAPSCFGDEDAIIAVESVLGGTAPYLYALNDQPLTAINLWNSLPPGDYDLSLEDANGCRWDTSFVIQEPVELELNLGVDIELQLGENANVEAQVNLPVNLLDTIIWAPEGLLECIDPLCLEGTVSTFNTVSLSATVIDQNGCRATDELSIIMEKDRKVFIPTAFSPNGDGSNDIFLVFGDESQIVKINKFLIFNRWGEVVHEALDFQPNDPDSGWDGTFKSERMNPGVFVYLAEIEFIDGWVQLYKGDVTLMK